MSNLFNQLNEPANMDDYIFKKMTHNCILNSKKVNLRKKTLFCGVINLVIKLFIQSNEISDW